jgi:N-methylhydantoinase A/oxoprolinase/acetone carboxylase beta subunit
MTGKLIVGVDVGGTFTDLFFLDEASGKSWIGKVPSTRGREAEGFLNGVRAGVGDISQIGTVVHGTTVGTNALLERKGGKAGVIATEGFRDVLEMRRRDRPQTWGLWGQFEPVVPRERRVETREGQSIRPPIRLKSALARASFLRSVPRLSRSRSSTHTPTLRTNVLQQKRSSRSGQIRTSTSRAKSCRKSVSSNGRRRPCSMPTCSRSLRTI